MTIYPQRVLPIAAAVMTALVLLAATAQGQMDHSNHAHSTEFAKQMQADMTKMDAGMKDAPMTGDPDVDFAAMMIPHHQGAVDMAKTQLKYGKDPVLRKLAEDIIASQEKEITLMKGRLEELKKKLPPPPVDSKGETTTTTPMDHGAHHAM